MPRSPKALNSAPPPAPEKETSAFTPSIEFLPTGKAAVLFVSDSSRVFREDKQISPSTIDDEHKYMPWGGDNLMPYNILDLFERDETLATCAEFNAEALYGDGLFYDTSKAIQKINDAVEDFTSVNNISLNFLGACKDLKMFAFSVSVIILSNDLKSITSVRRREAMYCRFSPADDHGRINYVYYYNWRNAVDADKVEIIPLLDPETPLADLRQRVAKGDKTTKYAVLSRIPTVDHTYYPIPYYAALFKGNWYNIKRLIGVAKQSKIGNSAPIKYHIEIQENYWRRMFHTEGITDKIKQQQRIVEEKENIIEFLTTAENAGKVWFSSYYTTPDGREQHDVKITKIDDSKEGGDWSTDIQEAVNMICFTMRVHSNLVGSVPGKAQTNNSRSDKRELFTIAQAMQKPYRDILFSVHKLIINYNGWKRVKPACPFMQLTTLDSHTDARKVSQT